MNFKSFLYFIAIILITSCASYKANYADKKAPKTITITKELVHSFYLIGDAGNAKKGQTIPSLTYFKKELTKADKNSTALFLGDNIYPYGMPKKESSERALAEIVYKLKLMLLIVLTVNQYLFQEITIGTTE